MDRETNLSYYGARYLDMKTSLWLSVDSLTERELEYSSYFYALTDPDGNGPDLPSWSNIKNTYNKAKKTLISHITTVKNLYLKHIMKLDGIWHVKL